MLENIKELLNTDLAIPNNEIIIDQIIENVDLDSGMQDLVALIPESSVPGFSPSTILDFSLYVRGGDPDVTAARVKTIYQYLHGHRGNAGTVAQGYNKLNLIEALSTPYTYSLTANGGDLYESVTKYRIHYVENNFDNF